LNIQICKLPYLKAFKSSAEKSTTFLNYIARFFFLGVFKVHWVFSSIFHSQTNSPLVRESIAITEC